MQLFANLVLLVHQLSLTSGLRVIDNGLGLAVYDSEESIVDYAVLASDKKAALPNQVLFLFFIFLLLAPQSGAHRITPHRDFHPIHPTHTQYHL